MSGILESLSPLLKGGTLDKISNLAGGSPRETKQVLDVALPASIAGLADSAATEGGSRQLLDRFKANDYPHLDPSQIGDLNPQSSQRLLDQSQGFLHRMLGDRQVGLVDALASSTGAERGLSAKLLGLAMPMVLGVVGKQALSRKLDAGGLGRFLAEQKSLVSGLLPGPLASFFGGAKRSAGVVAGSFGEPEVIQQHHQGRGPRMTEIPAPRKNYLPWILGALAALIGIGWLAGRPKQHQAAYTPPAVERPIRQGRTPAPPPRAPAPEPLRAPAPEPLRATTPDNAIARYLASDSTSPKRFVVDGIEFATGSTELNADSQTAAERLSATLIAHPNAKVRIEGYTDATGDDATNQRISLGRAQALKSYLVAHGVGADRVDVAAMGPQRPLAPNETAVDRQQNRRLEVLLTP